MKYYKIKMNNTRCLKLVRSWTQRQKNEAKNNRSVFSQDPILFIDVLGCVFYAFSFLSLLDKEFQYLP